MFLLRLELRRGARLTTEQTWPRLIPTWGVLPGGGLPVCKGLAGRTPEHRATDLILTVRLVD